MLKMDLHAIDAARMMAVAEPEKALEWNREALDLAEKSADAKANKANGPLYSNIGWKQFERKEYQEALFMFQKALESCEERGDAPTASTATGPVGRVLRV